MTPRELDDALHMALHATRWRPSRPFRWRRAIIWFTEPAVIIRGSRGVVQRWEAARHDTRGYGFTRRQAREIRAALIPVMRAEGDKLQALVAQQRANTHDGNSAD